MAEPQYEYVCGDGHSMSAYTPQSVCPVAICKHPTLKQVGRGSRKAAEQESNSAG